MLRLLSSCCLEVWYGFTCQPLDRHQPFHCGLCSSDGDGGWEDDSLDSISRLHGSVRGARAPWQPSESRVVIGLLCDAGLRLRCSSSTGSRLISAEALTLPMLQAWRVCQCDLSFPSNKFYLLPFFKLIHTCVRIYPHWTKSIEWNELFFSQISSYFITNSIFFYFNLQFCFSPFTPISPWENVCSASSSLFYDAGFRPKEVFARFQSMNRPFSSAYLEFWISR